MWSQGAYFEGDWAIVVLCTMFPVSCIFLNKCLYFSYYVTGYFLEDVHVNPFTSCFISLSNIFKIFPRIHYSLFWSFSYDGNLDYHFVFCFFYYKWYCNEQPRRHKTGHTCKWKHRSVSKRSSFCQAGLQSANINLYLCLQIIRPLYFTNPLL